MVFQCEDLQPSLIFQHEGKSQGGQIGQFFTSLATFCKLVEEIAFQNDNTLGYKFIIFSPE